MSSALEGLWKESTLPRALFLARCSWAISSSSYSWVFSSALSIDKRRSLIHTNQAGKRRTERIRIALHGKESDFRLHTCAIPYVLRLILFGLVSPCRLSNVRSCRIGDILLFSHCDATFGGLQCQCLFLSTIYNLSTTQPREIADGLSLCRSWHRLETGGEATASTPLISEKDIQTLL